MEHLKVATCIGRRTTDPQRHRLECMSIMMLVDTGTHWDAEILQPCALCIKTIVLCMYSIMYKDYSCSMKLHIETSIKGGGGRRCAAGTAFPIQIPMLCWSLY